MTNTQYATMQNTVNTFKMQEHTQHVAIQTHDKHSTYKNIDIFTVNNTDTQETQHTST